MMVIRTDNSASCEVPPVTRFRNATGYRNGENNHELCETHGPTVMSRGKASKIVMMWSYEKQCKNLMKPCHHGRLWPLFSGTKISDFLVYFIEHSNTVTGEVYYETLPGLRCAIQKRRCEMLMSRIIPHNNAYPHTAYPHCTDASKIGRSFKFGRSWVRYQQILSFFLSHKKRFFPST